MQAIFHLIRRNRKLFFKDKGMLFSSLITPLILLILYVTFLAKVYHDSFESAMPEGFLVGDALLNGCVGGQLFSSLLAVCCVTVACCVNLNMIQDKVTGARRDLMIAPVKSSTLALGYYLSTVINTLIICFIAMGACLIYIANTGWYLTAGDVGLLVLDIFLLVLFGTALASIICFPLNTQGQLSAVGTIISCGYGFICGAYMPISNFGEGLQKVLSYLPGTYGTALLKNHALRGVFEEMKTQGFPEEIVEAIRDSLDCNPRFGGEVVTTEQMFFILVGTIVVLMAVYIVMNVVFGDKVRKKKK